MMSLRSSLVLPPRLLLLLTQMITSSSRQSTIAFLGSLVLVSFFFSSCSNGAGSPSGLRTILLVLAGISLVSICLIVVARTTMVAWITVLVLLAFSGKRRRVLVHDRRKITADVVMHLIKDMVRERHFLTVICAAVISLLAMAQASRV